MNKRKILEAARKQVQKGARDKALKEYQKLLKVDPRDAKLRLEIGDAYRRWGQVDEAVDTYTRVAEQYTQEGFDARAVAVYKQIQNLVPDRYATFEPLADLYQRMGLTSEAIGALQTAADGYHRDGQRREALALLRKMASIDPSNTNSRIKVADLLRQEEMLEDAIVEYEEVVIELEKQGELETAGNVYERILEIEPNRVHTLTGFARSLLRRELPERAEPLAKRACELEAGVPEHLELLAEVFGAQKREDALADTYRELAQVYRQRGDEERARDILQRFVPTDGLAPPPDRPIEEREELLFDSEGSAFLEEPEEPPVVADDGADFGDADLLDEQLLTETFEGDAASAEPAPVEPVETLPVPDGDPDQLLAEANVYLRYGKRDQAIASLEAILAQDGEHRAALEKLGEAYAGAGDAEGAVETWLRAAELAREQGDEEAVGVLRGRIAAFDDAAAATLEGPTSAPEEPEPEAEEAAPSEPQPIDDTTDISLDDIEIDLEGDLEGDDLEDALAGEDAAAAPVADSELESQSVSGPSASSSTSQQITEDLEEADFYVQQGLHDEAEAIYQRVLSIAPNHPHALVRLGELAAARGEDPGATGSGIAADAGTGHDRADVSLGDGLGEDFDAISADAEPLDDATPPEPELSDGDAEIDIDLPDDGDEAALDFDAEPEPTLGEETLEDGPARDMDAEPEAPPDPVGAPPPAAEPSFDLAAELSEEFDDPDPNGSTSAGDTSSDGFSAVFREFKKGVSKTLSESDHEAHYDLGIAYREMGLLDDAIGEFRAAMGSPARRVECLHLIGLCELAQGRPQEAAAQFEAVLATPDLAADAALASRFTLGNALEALGRLDEARAAYEAVAAEDPSFCEVEERLAAIAEKSEEEAEDAAGDGPSEEFESFEDLMSDSAEDDDDSEPEPEVPESFESFEDVIAEANAEPERAPDPGESSDAIPLVDEVVPEPEPEPEPEAPPAPAPARKKKKISFL